MIVTTKKKISNKFPVLLENKLSGLMIYATGWQTEKKTSYKGFCIKSGDSKHTLGEELYWAKDAFIVFKGKLTIEQ